jgi:hypothetical protein
MRTVRVSIICYPFYSLFGKNFPDSEGEQKSWLSRSEPKSIISTADGVRNL